MERSSSMATSLIDCATRSLVHNRTSTGTRSIACLRRPAIAVSPFANEKGPARRCRASLANHILLHQCRCVISFLGLFVNLRGSNVLSVLAEILFGNFWRPPSLLAKFAFDLLDFSHCRLGVVVPPTFRRRIA